MAEWLKALCLGRSLLWRCEFKSHFGQEISASMLTQFPPVINEAFLFLFINCDLDLRKLNLSMQMKTHLEVYCNLYSQCSLQWAYALFYTECKEKMRQERHTEFVKSLTF